jgi:hypothetical protein
MGSRTISAATVAVLAGTTALAVGTAAPALADSAKVLGIKSVGDMLVDRTHQRVFVSDPTGGKVVATDYQGSPLGSAAVENATGLELSADSSQLYVTSPAGSAIIVLDTTTLDQTARYPTGVRPVDIAVAGGRLWFSYTRDSRGNLGTIDPAAASPEPVLDRFATNSTEAAEIAAASAAPNRLGVGGYGVSAILDVSGDTVTTVGSASTYQNVADLAISPDGNRIATVFGGDYTVTLREAGDMTAVKLPIEAYPRAVDIATDGTIAGGSWASYSPDLHIFSAAGKLIERIDIPNTGTGSGADELQRHGVAWEPGSSRLFAISENSANVFSLRSYDDPRRTQSALTLSRPSPADLTTPITVTGNLASPLGLPAGTPVSIVRDGTSLDSATIAADGSFSFTDTPPAAGKVTYEVTYAGDDTRAPSTATTSVEIARLPSTLALTGPSFAVPGQPVTITGTLTSATPMPTGAVVEILRSGTSLGTEAIAADGSFSFTDTPTVTGSTESYRVSYAGDDAHLPATATSPVGVFLIPADLTVAGPATAARAKPLTITGKLTSVEPLKASTTVSLSRTDLDHPAGTPLGVTTIGADGSYTFTDTPTAGGTVTYRASYAGDVAHSPATATTSVAVSRTTPALTLTNAGKVYDYGRTVSFTAHLGATYRNRTVEIWADPSGSDQPRRLVVRGVVNSAGNLTASIKLTRDTAVTAVFPGDSQTAARTVLSTVSTKVSLSLKLSKYYKSGKIGGKTYRYYHAKKKAVFATSMTGAASRKVYVSVQYYAKGKWRSLDTSYFQATDQLYLTGSGLSGTKLRVRTAYVRGRSGDSLNATTWTAYQYFTFTK